MKQEPVKSKTSVLARRMITFMVKNNNLIKGLLQAQTVILQYIPLSFELLVEKEVQAFLDESPERQTEDINPDGFVRFRLKNLNTYLDGIIGTIIKSYIVQQRYREFLNLIKAYIDESEPIADEMHIMLLNRPFDVQQAFDILIDMLPKKLIIYNPSDFPDKNFLKSIEFVFEGRIEYFQKV